MLTPAPSEVTRLFRVKIYDRWTGDAIDSAQLLELLAYDFFGIYALYYAVSPTARR